MGRPIGSHNENFSAYYVVRNKINKEILAYGDTSTIAKQLDFDLTYTRFIIGRFRNHPEQSKKYIIEKITKAEYNKLLATVNIKIAEQKETVKAVAQYNQELEDAYIEMVDTRYELRDQTETIEGVKCTHCGRVMHKSGFKYVEYSASQLDATLQKATQFYLCERCSSPLRKWIRNNITRETYKTNEDYIDADDQQDYR